MAQYWLSSRDFSVVFTPPLSLCWNISIQFQDDLLLLNCIFTDFRNIELNFHENWNFSCSSISTYIACNAKTIIIRLIIVTLYVSAVNIGVLSSVTNGYTTTCTLHLRKEVRSLHGQVDKYLLLDIGYLKSSLNNTTRELY